MGDKERCGVSGEVTDLKDGEDNNTRGPTYLHADGVADVRGMSSTMVVKTINNNNTDD